MSETTLTYTEADFIRWRNERRAAEPPTVTFGDWEATYGPERTRQVATDVRGLFFQTVVEWTEVKDEPITGYRRRRMETWFDAEGRQMGRWEWQYAGLDMEPIETPTAMRGAADKLGEAMG